LAKSAQTIEKEGLKFGERQRVQKSEARVRKLLSTKKIAVVAWEGDGIEAKLFGMKRSEERRIFKVEANLRKANMQRSPAPSAMLQHKYYNLVTNRSQGIS